MDMRPLTIVVGIDGSEHGRAALGVATDLAERCAGRVVTVHARGLLEEAAIRRHESVDTHGAELVIDGSPYDAIVEAVRRVEADLIVVGRRASGRAGVVLGSTSHRLAESAPVPVVVVPPGASEP
jgi:nucleotide-binding universal stress UspA family protein